MKCLEKQILGNMILEAIEKHKPLKFSKQKWQLKETEIEYELLFKEG